MSYAEVAARSNFSLLDGASHPAELVLAAQAQGHAGLGICDTNSLAGVVRGHVAAKEAGLAFVVGCRLVLRDGSAWLAWPTNRAAYGRLTALLSQGRMRAPKGECQLERADLFAAAEGMVLAALPPEAPDVAPLRADGVTTQRADPATPLGADAAAQLRADAAMLRDRLALPLLLATACTHRGDDQQRLDRLAAIGLPLLATNDVRYHAPGRRRLADVLSAIRLGTTVDALGYAAEPNAERHLKPPAEMARLFRRYPEALANSLRVLQAASGFSLDQLRFEYPEEILEPGQTAQQTLAARVAAALEERWPGDTAPEPIRARLRHELRLIEQLSYAPYFLTVDQIVRFARSQGILCQGRGSAANSTVCYVLGITAIDPDKHDLLFERFVSASRDEPPDIDVDFEHERREEVIQHIYERYGRHRAAIVATVIRFRAKSAVREVGKVLGLSEDVTGRLAKGTWRGGGDRSLAEVVAAEGLDPADWRVAATIELAEEIQDFPRHLATHVGGFIITRGPLVETAVVGKAAMPGRTVLEWDKDDIDALGMMKVDILALGMLSCLRRGLDLLRRHHRLALGLADLPRDCAETYAMLRRADSVGVFQVESRAQMNMLPLLKPEKFYDLVVQVAIVRPGPIQGDMVHPYLRRRQGLEQPVYPRPHPDHGPPDELRKVLGKTLGVPLFQEQAMRVAIAAAGFSADEADRLRKSMATFKQTGGVSAYHDKLVGGMTRRGYDPDLAERVFKQIEGFGSYGFPESHAASFALLAYASAWMKCHHPAVFAAALLNSQPMGFYAPAQIVRDARDHRVAVRPIDVNHSDWDCGLEPDAASTEGLALRLGLRMVSGLAVADGKAVAQARRSGNGAPFANVEELARRAELGRPALEALGAADAFRSLGRGRRAALWDAAAVERRGATAGPLFDFAASDAPLLAEPAPRLPPEREGEAVVEDYLAAGLTLRRHPLAVLRPVLDRLGLRDTRHLAALRQGGWLRLAGLVLMRQRPGTAKGVIFVTVEDEHGQANIVVYASIAARDRTALVGARLLVVEGRVERAAAQAEVPIIHLIARALVDRSDLLEGLREAGGSDWAERTLGRADEVRRPEPGSARPELGRSRDFR